MANRWYYWQGPNLILQVRVYPRASRDEVAEPQGERLRVRITAPPVDGKANAHFCRFLAKTFQVPKSSITLISGANTRDKRVCINAPRYLLPGMLPSEDDNTVA